MSKSKDPTSRDVDPQAASLIENWRQSAQKSKQSLSPADVEQIRAVLYKIRDFAIANTRVVVMVDGICFPVTTLKLREIARELYASNSGILTHISKDSTTKAHRQFLFTGVPTNPNGGGQMEWSELPCEEIMRRLPKAFCDLRKGREPEDREFQIVGYPTNVTGYVSPTAVKEFKNEGLSALAEYYQAYISSELVKLEGCKAILSLKAVSLGASIALYVADGLLENTVVQQSTRASDLPYMDVLLYGPAAMLEMNTMPWRRIQKVLGLGLEFAWNYRNKGTRLLQKEMPRFLKMLYTRAPQAPVRMDKAQRNIKRHALSALHKSANAGVRTPKHVAATVILGRNDTLVWSWGRNKAFATFRKRSRPGKRYMLETLLPRSSPEYSKVGIAPNIRLFGVRMGHQPTFYRPRVWAYFNRVLRYLSALKAEKNVWWEQPLAHR